MHFGTTDDVRSPLLGVPDEVLECCSLTSFPPRALWFLLRRFAARGDSDKHSYRMTAEVTAKCLARCLTVGKPSGNGTFCDDCDF